MAKVATRTNARLAPNFEPNVIPFIDVLLVLLIIFMVTAPKPTSDLRVDLPRAGSSIAAALAPAIVQLRRTPGGVSIYVGGAETTLNSVAASALASLLAAGPSLTPEDARADGRIFVRADLDVDYQHVVSVVERLQQARFQHVAIAAQNADAS